MKRLTPAFLAAVLLCFNLALAQSPDPRNSIIIESKTVNPGTGKPAARVKVFITNKDTLAAVSIGLIEKSLTGGAYMTLARPRMYDSVITRLTSTLGSWRTFYGGRYNSSSPDTIVFGGFFDPETETGFEPPNLVRKPFFEINFDSIWLATGTLVLDSLRWEGGYRVQFVANMNKSNYDVPVNFIKGIITVVESEPPPCNDMNGDGSFTSADIVGALNCVFSGIGDCGPISAPSDVVKLLRSLFSGPMPLIPPTPCE